MTIFWTVWLIGIGVTFAAAETYALLTGRQTLSRWVWTVSKDFPAFPWLVGMLVGFLGCHFWWGGALSCFTPP
jgi:hypothetical protein